LRINHPSPPPRGAGHVVGTAADGDRKALAAREADRRDHVAGARPARDQHRRAVDHAVPDAAGGLVGVVARDDELALEGIAEVADGGFAEGAGHGRLLLGRGRRRNPPGRALERLELILILN
jgi:hypothetical protein